MVITSAPIHASSPVATSNQNPLNQELFYELLAQENVNAKSPAEIIAGLKLGNITYSKERACFREYGFFELDDINEANKYESLVKNMLHWMLN